MKKFLAWILVFVLVLALTACGEKEKTSDEPVEIVVFAAASMTETLTEIGNTYMAEHENVKLVFNFGSSGTLKTQIQEGAVCDVFISAGQKQVNQLDKNDTSGDNTEGLDLILDGTRLDLLENKVTLCVPDPDAADAVKSFDDMAARLRAGDILLAMGNADVPVGQYTQKILAYYGLSEEELASAGCITYGSDVKEVTTQVREAAVDCGVIYCTDAFSAGLTIIDYATAAMCGQIIYPAALINTTEHEAEAQAFLDYLSTDAAMAVFEGVGFSPAA